MGRTEEDISTILKLGSCAQDSCRIFVWTQFSQNIGKVVSTVVISYTNKLQGINKLFCVLPLFSSSLPRILLLTSFWMVISLVYSAHVNI